MIAVIIPTYRVKNHIINVINSIGTEVESIYVVDDCCPDRSGQHVLKNCHDKRLKVTFLKKNRGVGGAVLEGYKQALSDGASIMIKIDGDGQMNCAMISKLIKPIIDGKADYTKGNRFFDIEALHSMPKIRLVGNAGLSLINKFASGYWNIMDPTNGFTAIHSKAANKLPFNKISQRYFFESDLLFRLNIIGAVVQDVSMSSLYDDEQSSLNVLHSLLTFPSKYMKRFLKRLLYNYFLTDFNLATLSLITGASLILFGTIFGVTHWLHSIISGVYSSTGTVMIPTLSIIIGFQLLLFFFQIDISSIPTKPLQKET